MTETFHSQQLTGQLLAAIFAGMHADVRQSFTQNRKKVHQLYRQLDSADLLLVVVELGRGGVIPVSVERQTFLTAVHLARQGPPKELEDLLDQSAGSRDEGVSQPSALINYSHNGFPLLFQPLIELHPGWLSRLRALLAAGANASVIYRPWNCSALQMLLYRKTGGKRRASEGDLLQATRLLLERGATSCLDLKDHAGDNGCVHQRTALIQAASAGRLEVCRVLLQAGANFDLIDSNDQSMLDYLFYLKHSNLQKDKHASAGYTCMQLSGLVQEFRMQALITDELAQDCDRCGRCRFLLAPLRDIDDSESVPTSDASEGEDDFATSDSDEQQASQVLLALTQCTSCTETEADSDMTDIS